MRLVMNGLRGIAGDGMQTVTNINALCEKYFLITLF